MYFLCLCFICICIITIDFEVDNQCGGRMLRGLAKIFSSVLHRHLGYPKVPVLKKILYFERIKYFIFKKKFISPWRERAWKAPFLSRQCTLRLPPGRKYSKDLRENIFSSEEKYFYTCGEISLCLTNLSILHIDNLLRNTIT